MQVELLLHFDRRPRTCPVVEIGGQLQRLPARVALDFVVLALDVARVLRLDLDLLGDRGSSTRAASAGQRQQRAYVDIRPAQQIGERVFALHRLPENALLIVRRYVAD